MIKLDNYILDNLKIQSYNAGAALRQIQFLSPRHSSVPMGMRLQPRCDPVTAAVKYQGKEKAQDRFEGGYVVAVSLS